MDGWALLGSGNGRKLERFGDVIVERPCPQAIWPQTGHWKTPAAVFQRQKDGSGEWDRAVELPDAWEIDMLGLCFEIRLTGFGNVGLFPEHSAHFDWMADQLASVSDAEVLNLFGYTGAASLYLAKKGARVTHVDAAKSVNGWAVANAEHSRIEKKNIRIIADDALKFAKREARRRRQYHGIILDPPTFGRGARGEVWKIERDLYLLMQALRPLISADTAFVLVTSHSPGVTPSVLRNLLSSLKGDVSSGEMLLSGAGWEIPAGVFARWTQ